MVNRINEPKNRITTTRKKKGTSAENCNGFTLLVTFSTNHNDAHMTVPHGGCKMNCRSQYTVFGCLFMCLYVKLGQTESQIGLTTIYIMDRLYF